MNSRTLKKILSVIAPMIFLYSTVTYAHSAKKPIIKNQDTALISTNFIQSRNHAIKLKFYGLVNQDLFYAGDGYRSRTFFGNDSVSTSRFGVHGIGILNDDTNLFGTMEIGVLNNSSYKVSQLNPAPGNSLQVRIAEVGVNSKHFGKLSLGQGYTASDNSAEADLSGTNAISKSSVEKMGGGLIFSNAHTGSLAGNPAVHDAFSNLDGLSRLSRLRYDTPKFHGFYVSASAIQENQHDIVLRYVHQFDYVKIAAALAYVNSSLIDKTVPGYSTDGSATALLNNGLNLTFAGGEVFANDKGRKNPNYTFLKPGYRAHLNNFGTTNFSVDYGIFKHFSANNDTAKTFGADVVQRFKAWQTEIYVGYRQFSLNRPKADFNNIKLIAAGVRIVF
jgi:predicted porin